MRHDESREETPACEEGWIRLADKRYEARDTQYLLGLLADEKIVKPQRDRRHRHLLRRRAEHRARLPEEPIRLPSGEFAPWTSPDGKKLEVKAAYPRWPWSDLVNALEPNGRFLETEVAPSGQSYEPIGVEIQSYNTGLYADGEAGAATTRRPARTKKRTSRSGTPTSPPVNR